MQRRAEFLILLLVLSSFFGIYTFAKTKNPETKKPTSVATFAGGCFWCMQEAMDQVEGVVSTRVGYTGGQQPNPSYQEVSEGITGHTESVEVIYYPEVLSYQTLLDVFWKNIDPTVENQQFCDKGSQYRSAIFYHTPEQKKLAEASKQKLLESNHFDQIYTEISPASDFFEAEKYHHNYYKKNPIRYKFYKYLCGREQRLKEIWGE